MVVTAMTRAFFVSCNTAFVRCYNIGIRLNGPVQTADSTISTWVESRLMRRSTGRPSGWRTRKFDLIPAAKTLSARYGGCIFLCGRYIGRFHFTSVDGIK